VQILVTGGAGFIGSHLVDALVAGGHRVRVLDNLSTGAEENLADHLGSPAVRFVEGSVTDPAAVASALDGCELVYHLAAAIGVRYVMDDPLAGIATNVRGTEEVLAAAARAGARVVLASSSEVYGKAPPSAQWQPFREDQDSVIGPTSVTRWWYALAKGLDEHLGFAYHRQRGLAVSAVRYFNIYGPRCRPGGYGVIARFVTQALRGEALTVFGDGSQSRSFTYVTDAVRATILAGTRPEAVGEVFNVGSGSEVTIGETAELVRRLTSPAAPIIHTEPQAVYGPNFEDTHRRVPNTAKAERLLGFKAEVGLADGIMRTARWWSGPPSRL
jgi:UDP-glucose 4-epimerase